MIKKYAILFLLGSLLFGCENKSENKWIEDAQYNTAFIDIWRKISTYNTENGIITYAEVQDSKGQPYYYPLYITEEGVFPMDTDVSSTCTYSNVDACKNLFPYAHNGLDYYKGKIYYTDFVIDENVTGYQININEADINGYNHKKKFTVIDYIPFEEASGLAYIEFHRNNIYVNLFGDLYIGNLDSGKLEKVIIEGVQDVWRVFMLDETLYITTEEYNDGSKVYFDVILECDLNGKLKGMVHDNMLAALIDENFIFYRDRENLTWHTYNRNTKEKKQIDDTLYYYVLKYEDTYLLETTNMLTDTFKITILNKDGKIIHTKDYTNDEYYNGGLLYTGDRYYVCTINLQDQMEWYGYYEITDEGISNLKMFELMKN